MLAKGIAWVMLIAALAGCSTSPTVVVDNQTGTWFVGLVQIPTRSDSYPPAPSTRNELVIDARGPERFRSMDRGFSPVDSCSQDVTVGVRLQDRTWWLVSIPWNGEPEVFVAIRTVKGGTYEAATNVDAPMKARHVPADQLEANLGKPR